MVYESRIYGCMVPLGTMGPPVTRHLLVSFTTTKKFMTNVYTEATRLTSIDPSLPEPAIIVSSTQYDHPSSNCYRDNRNHHNNEFPEAEDIDVLFYHVQCDPSFAATKHEHEST